MAKDKIEKWLSPPMNEYSVMYSYVRSRQLEGTYNDDPTVGCWPITGLRVARGWGTPLEEQWPYVGDASLWPPKEEPANIDLYAKEYRLFAYQRVRSEIECKIAIASESPVMLAVNINDSWYNAIKGDIPLPHNEVEIVGAHCFEVLGYDDAKAKFKFKNSWGVEWGDKGYGYLPYQYIDRFMVEAWILIVHSYMSYKKKGGGTVELNWGIPTKLHGALHGIEIRDSESNDYKAWGFASLYDGYLNVEEFFVHPDFRGKGYSKYLLNHLRKLSVQFSAPLRFWVSHADNTNNNMELLKYLANKNGLVVSDSNVRWAAFKIEQGGIPIKYKPAIKVPGVAHPSTYRLPV
jgi:GNAT superfamily N-acetyltransferase